jgi:hypothetical protein
MCGAIAARAIEAARTRQLPTELDMPESQEGAVRARIAQWMAEGLSPQTSPFPEYSAQFAELIADFRVLDPNDLKPKLVKCGLTNHPVGPDRMRCQECMHYLGHRM